VAKLDILIKAVAAAAARENKNPSYHPTNQNQQNHAIRKDAPRKKSNSRSERAKGERQEEQTKHKAE
jgi:stringent starvation protein B